MTLAMTVFALVIDSVPFSPGYQPGLAPPRIRTPGCSTARSSIRAELVSLKSDAPLLLGRRAGGAGALSADQAMGARPSRPGVFTLHTSRNPYAGATCVVATDDLKQALLDEIRRRSARRARPWRYLAVSVLHPAHRVGSPHRGALLAFPNGSRYARRQVRRSRPIPSPEPSCPKAAADRPPSPAAAFHLPRALLRRQRARSGFFPTTPR